MWPRSSKAFARAMREASAEEAERPAALTGGGELEETGKLEVRDKRLRRA